MFEKSWAVEPGNEANRTLSQVPKVPTLEGFHSLVPRLSLTAFFTAMYNVLQSE